MSTKSTNPRRQPEPHATRVYLLVDRNTGKAFDCSLTRKGASAQRKAFAERQAERDRAYTFAAWEKRIRIVPATATPTPPKGKAGAP